MGSTFVSLHYHIVFSTKYRKPWILDAWRDRLHEYLGGTIRGLKGVAEAIGGVEDHVHLLVSLRATHTLADVVRELKKAGTAWVHDQQLNPQFVWQEGYAAFTVSPNSRDGVRGYIANQVEHHRKESPIDELKRMLAAAGVEYDPQYLE
ncbi:MAG TPA: IS200/IS605 family transposase [Gemmataceae bacterium]|jgi:REP element-mobilizing transposase RayT|nr:IS200/IS605 family transposase [Gemmataceae bacterium]